MPAGLRDWLRRARSCVAAAVFSVERLLELCLTQLGKTDELMVESLSVPVPGMTNYGEGGTVARLMFEPGATSVPISPAVYRHTLGDVARRTARRYPTKPAIICENTIWTYDEFDRLCNRVANGLSAQGVGKGDRVAILARNSHLFAALRFGVARLGAVLVPINFMLNAEEAAYILRHSGARTLAVGPELVDTAAGAAVMDTAVERLVHLSLDVPPPLNWLSFGDLLVTDDREPTVDLDGRDLAQIIYTSGTEAQPKGAMLTHEALLWEYTTCVIEQELAPDDVMLHALPLYHCAQLDAQLGPAIYLGLTNVILGVPRPETILPLLERWRVTAFFSPPTVWISLLRSPLFDQTDLSALRKGYYGASIMPIEVLKELARRLPDVRLWNFYGQTEIAPVATVLRPNEQFTHLGSAGKACVNVETRIVDEHLRDVAPGAVGEIVHRSPQLLTGYFHDDVHTREAFAGGWFHSGDLGTVDADGYITIVDRKKDVIKTGGENVASRDVEDVIYRLPEVEEVAVVGLPDPLWIEAVAAVVVPRSGAQLTEAEVIAHCRQHLAHFKAPRRVIFVEELPKNPSGKILKRTLREKFRT